MPLPEDHARMGVPSELATFRDLTGEARRSIGSSSTRGLGPGRRPGLRGRRDHEAMGTTRPDTGARQNVTDLTATPAQVQEESKPGFARSPTGRTHLRRGAACGT